MAIPDGNHVYFSSENMVRRTYSSKQFTKWQLINRTSLINVAKFVIELEGNTWANIGSCRKRVVWDQRGVDPHTWTSRMRLRLKLSRSSLFTIPCLTNGAAPSSDIHNIPFTPIGWTWILKSYASATTANIMYTQRVFPNTKIPIQAILETPIHNCLD